MSIPQITKHCISASKDGVAHEIVDKLSLNNENAFKHLFPNVFSFILAFTLFSSFLLHLICMNLPTSLPSNFYPLISLDSDVRIFNKFTVSGDVISWFGRQRPNMPPLPLPLPLLSSLALANIPSPISLIHFVIAIMSPHWILLSGVTSSVRLSAHILMADPGFPVGRGH